MELGNLVCKNKSGPQLAPLGYGQHIQASPIDAPNISK